MGNSLTKFIFVTGGVVSSLGKGITSASLGALLERTLRMSWQAELDPEVMIPMKLGYGEIFYLCFSLWL